MELTGPSDYFLSEHFKHCLRVHLVGGDIHEDYSSDVIVKTLEDLGLSNWEDEDEVVPINDSRWDTELGKEILESHMRSKLSMDGYESE